MTIQLAETRQRSRSHPNDEILVLEPVIFRILRVQQPKGFLPRLGLGESLQGRLQIALGVSELDLLVRGPGDASSQHGHLSGLMFRFERVNLQSVCWESVISNESKT